MAQDNLGLSPVALRLRELKFLRDVSAVLRRGDNISIENWLAELAQVMQREWPYSNNVGVRIRLGPAETGSSANLPAQYRASLVTAAEGAGSIEIRRGGHEHEQPAFGAGDPDALLEFVVESLAAAVDRRAAAMALRDSEQRYRSAVEQQSDLVCRYLPDTTLTYANEAYCRFVGKPRGQVVGRQFVEFIPETERPVAFAHVESLMQGGEPHIYEHDVLLPDGSVGRQQWVDHAIRLPDGRIEELQGIGRDITVRWRAEEALRQQELRLREAYERIRSLAHRLMLAQEAERTEIARDLHDDVGQQLAALGIGLTLIEGQLGDRTTVRAEVTEMRRMASGLADKVRHVSHALHPGVLQHAGLRAAIASHCDAVASQHAFGVHFDSRGAFGDLPADVSLCLYRVVQQALRNVAMHADASSAWVLLTRSGTQIDLAITDDGRGFDLSVARVHGLGLLSIEERVHLVNGVFTVSSRLGGGTTLTITVPVQWG